MCIGILVRGVFQSLIGYNHSECIVKNTPENWDLKSYNPYVINLKEHFCNNVEGYSCQSSLFVDAEWQHHGCEPTSWEL